MSTLKNSQMITAILPKGVALQVVDLLKNEKNIITANFIYARGVGKMTPLKHRGLGEQSEREILTTVVPQERGEEIFEYIFNVAEIDKPHGGFIYMYSMLSSEYTLPENVAIES